jgi:hypothetical protein
VVIKVDVAINADAQFAHVGEHVTIEVLVFEDRPEAFGVGVVVARAGLAHRADDAELPAELDDFIVGESTAPVRIKPKSA